MQEFNDWRTSPDNKDLLDQPISEEMFRQFLSVWKPPRESFFDGLAGLMYEVYEIQFCLEALIEDIQNIHGD